MRRAATLVTLATIALPAAASAQRLTPAEQTMLTRYLPMADNIRPTSPCAGHLNVTISDNASADATAITGREGDGLSAFTQGGCRITIQRGMGDLHFCTLLLHEAVHAAGEGHTDGGLMDPEPSIYPPCREAAPTPSRTAQASRVLTHKWARRWSCRTSGTLVRCLSPAPNADAVTMRATVRVTSRRGVVHYLIRDEMGGTVDTEAASFDHDLDDPILSS